MCQHWYFTVLLTNLLFFFSCTVAAGKAVLKYSVFSRLSISLNIVKIALEPGN